MPVSFAVKVQTSSFSGKSTELASSAKRAGNLIRPTSPKSPVASASAFESVEGSDDEDNMTDNAKLGTVVSLFSTCAACVCQSEREREVQTSIISLSLK